MSLITPAERGLITATGQPKAKEKCISIGVGKGMAVSNSSSPSLGTLRGRFLAHPR